MTDQAIAHVAAEQRHDGLFNVYLMERHAGVTGRVARQIGVAGQVERGPHGRVKTWTPARDVSAPPREDHADRIAAALLELFTGPPKADVTTAEGRDYEATYELDLE